MIRWKAVPVVEAMDRIEETFSEILVQVEKCRQEVLEASRGANLPEYLTQRIGTLKYTIDNTIPSLRSRVGSVREAIPEGAVESERKRGESKNML